MTTSLDWNREACESRRILPTELDSSTTTSNANTIANPIANQNTIANVNHSRRTRTRRRMTTSVWFVLATLLLLVGLLGVFAVAEAQDNDNDNDTNDNDDEEDDFVCNVYLAPSTLVGTGLGMYAGAKGFSANELITKTLGDHMIPLTDQKTAQSDTGLYDRSSTDRSKYFLWDQYTWTASALGFNLQYLSQRDIDLASPGFGAAANSFMDFVNVDEGGVQFGLLPPEPGQPPYRLHRSKDPGAGGFTPYHTRKAVANQDIAPNSEFFVSYGDEWFTDRVWRLGTIPVTGDHEEAEYLWKMFCKEFLGKASMEFGPPTPEEAKEFQSALRRYDEDDTELVDWIRHFRRKHYAPLQPPRTPELAEIYQEFWDEVVVNFGKTVWGDSRIMASLPADPFSPEYEEMLTTEGGYKAVKRKSMKRTPEWLQEHGICADSVRIGRSSLPNQQAGHGAFAKTTFREGEVIMAAPLIHIPDRAILDTFYKTEQFYSNDDEEEDEDYEDYDVIANEEELNFRALNREVLFKHSMEIGYMKTGSQLLLNYVFGHRDSTMALSPYGPGVQLINHNQTLANCKLQWAEPKRSNHHPELLEESVDYINDHFSLGSVLGMEIVATKPIGKDEELFLDYGDEWEQAWQDHISNWKPLEGSEDYLSAIDLNSLPEYLHQPLPNWYGREGETNPFPKTVQLTMSSAWKDKIRDDEGDDYITETLMYEDFDFLPVEAVFKTGTVDNPYKYLFEDKTLFDKLTEQQQLNVRTKYDLIVAQQQQEEQDSDKPEGDDSLYTVVVRAPFSDEAYAQAEQTGRQLPPVDKITCNNVPRRGLKFEDLGYTTDQFLPNAFREYIRIPDEIFPEAWKNLPTDQDKQDHYWKYKDKPDEPDRVPWYELMQDEIEELRDNNHEGDVYGEEDEPEEEDEKEIPNRRARHFRRRGYDDEEDGDAMSMYDVLEEEGEEGDDEF